MGGLLQCSAYSVGLAYEQLVLKVLQRYGFQLMHTGGPGDGGQDFNGFWLLPHKRIPVLGKTIVPQLQYVFIIVVLYFNFTCSNFHEFLQSCFDRENVNLVKFIQEVKFLLSCFVGKRENLNQQN